MVLYVEGGYIIDCFFFFFFGGGGGGGGAFSLVLLFKFKFNHIRQYNGDPCF